MTRSESSRLWRFWCWIWFGHDRDVPGRTTGVCARCGSELIGGD